MKIIEGASYKQEIYKEYLAREYLGEYKITANVNKKPFEDSGTVEGL